MREARLTCRVGVSRVPSARRDNGTGYLQRALTGMRAGQRARAVMMICGRALRCRMLPPPGGRLPWPRISRAVAAAAASPSSMATLR
jgi:hypothetical protein